MRRLGGGLSGAALVFALLTLAVMQLGAQRYRPPTLLADLAACQFRCWNGIIPGETDLASADLQLAAHGFEVINEMTQAHIIYRAVARDCWISLMFDGSLVKALNFQSCGSMTVGDVIVALGAPQRSLVTDGALTWLSWHEGQIDATTTALTSPLVSVLDLGLNSADSVMANIRSSGRQWRGFIPFWRYCRLEQVTAYCGDRLETASAVP